MLFRPDTTLVTPESDSGKVTIGQLYIGSLKEYGQKPNRVQALQLNKSVSDGDSGTHYIISWKQVPSNKYYNIYVNGQFYGATYQNIEDVMTSDSSTKNAEICVVPQSPSGVTGRSQCISPGKAR